MISLNPFSSSHRSWLRDNYTSTIDGIRLTVSENEKEAYATACELILQREIKNGKFGSGSLKDVKDFNIPLSLCATYTNPQSGNTEYVDLISIDDDEDIQNALNNYYEVSGAKKALTGISIAPHSKGNLRGASPLDTKGDAVLIKLIQSHTFGHVYDKLLPEILLKYPDPQSREIITRRLLFVEEYHTKKTASLEAAIKAKTDALANAGGNQQIIRSLQNEINRLQGLLNRFKNVDLYALCKVLLFYPIETPSNEQINQLTSFLENSVSQDIYDQGASWADKIPFRKRRELTAAQNEYAKRVAAVACKSREEYFRYCEKHNLPKENEGIEDLYLREALKFSTNFSVKPDGTYSFAREYEAEGFQKSILLNGFPEPLKTELKGEFAKFGVLATHAIGFRNPGEYEVAPPEAYPDPANVTEAAKKAVDARNAAKAKADVATLKEHIAAHRSRVRRDMTVDQLPQPANPGPLDASVVASGPLASLAPRVLTAATAAVTIGTQLVPAAIEAATPWVPTFVEGGSRAIQAIGSWVPQSVVNGVRAIQALAPEVPEIVVSGGRAIQSVTPWVTQTAVNVFSAIQNHPGTTMVLGTLANRALANTWANERGPDGIVRRRFKPKRVLAMMAVGTAGALAYYHAPQAAQQMILATADQFKNWIFLPANVAAKLFAGLFVVEKVAKTVNSNIKERKWVRLGGLLAVGTAAVLMYRAVNDGVVDNKVLEIAGDWVGSQLTTLTDIAYNAYDYSSATRVASMIGLSWLLAWKEGKSLSPPEVVASVAMGMSVKKFLVAGKEVVNRELPQPVATILNAPADGILESVETATMVQNGTKLGEAAVGIWGFAGKFFSKASEMAGGLRDAYEQMRLAKTPPSCLI